MSRITLEAASLADAVQKASRVAPVKGSAFDRFAGIYIEVADALMVPMPVIVRATNGEVTYQQKLGAVEYEGPANWRIPSSLLAGLLTSLPLDGGRTITLVDRGDSFIRIVAGKVKAKLNMITGEWPLFPAFEDFTEFSSASDFAAKVDQVAWATHPDNAPLAGVHVNGEWLIACDRYVMARIPCTAPISEPITAPLKNLSRLIANGTEVKIKAIEKKLYVMLDAETQATTSIYGESYPAVTSLLRDTYTGWVSFDGQELVDAITRQLVLVKGERYPQLKLSFDTDGSGGVNMVLDMDVPGVGRLQDSLDCKGAIQGDVFEMWCNPTWIQNALNACKGDQIKLEFGPDPKQNMKITDGKGFECYIQPAVKAKEKADKPEKAGKK